MTAHHAVARALLLELGPHRPFYLKLVTTECQLVGNLFGYLIQVLLAVSAFSALIIKKVTDKSPRTWKHWARDTSKQAFGSAVVHFANLAISYYLLDSTTYTDPCVFYEVSFLVDACLGTILNIAFCKLIEWVDRKYWQTGRLQTGFYGHPASWWTWTVQTLEWVLITAIVKLILLYAVLVPLISQLYAAGEWLNSPFASNPHLELVMVMIVVPLVMNALVFWNTDAWIMDSSSEPLTPYQLLEEQSDEFACCRPRLVTTPKSQDTAARRCFASSRDDDCSPATDVVVVAATPHANGDQAATPNGAAGVPANATVVVEPESVSRGLVGGSTAAPLLRGGHSQSASSFTAAKLKSAWAGLTSSSPAGTHFFGRKVPARHQDYHRL